MKIVQLHTGPRLGTYGEYGSSKNGLTNVSGLKDDGSKGKSSDYWWLVVQEDWDL